MNYQATVNPGGRAIVSEFNSMQIVGSELWGVVE